MVVQKQLFSLPNSDQQTEQDEDRVNINKMQWKMHQLLATDT